MANNHKGEVSTKVDGERITMKFTLNILADIEAETGKGLGEIQKKMDKQEWSLTFMRAMLWGGMNGGGHDVTLQEAGDYLQKMIQSGKKNKHLKRLMKSFALSLQSDEEASKMDDLMEKRSKRPTAT